MSPHLPVLQVLVPLFGALLCALIRHRLVCRILAVLVAWASLAIAGMLLSEVLRSGEISYMLGGFVAPWGIEYRVDQVNAYVLVLVSTISSVVFAAGPGAAIANIPAGRGNLFYAAMLLCLTGLLGITITGDLFNVFVFLEISSLASYTLIGLGPGRRGPMAAFSYLSMGTIGGTFFLLGIGLMYQMTGTLNMADLAALLPKAYGTRTPVLAMALMCVGLSVKLAVFPLHQWLPNAYAAAPAVVSAFLAATSTKVMYYVLVRVVFTLFGAAFVFGQLKLHLLLIPLSLGGMFVGSLAAIYQTSLKRLLAYSSVAQIGYMTLGLSLNSVTGLSAGLIHLFNHALMKGGLFLVVACVALRVGSDRIQDMRGLGRRMPLTMAAFVMGGLALIGVPGTVGFVSKWYLVQAAIEKGWYTVVVLILLSSLLALVYVWRVVEVAYFRQPDDDTPAAREAPWNMLLPTWVLIGATLYFGLSTDLTVGVARAAAAQLMRIAP